jgi:predicted RND superfamily exporter protein
MTKNMKWFEKKISHWVIKYRWWIIFSSLIAVIIAASGARFLTISNDTRVFFSDKNPQLQALEALENTYNRIDNVLFAIAPKNGNVFSRKTLSAIEELTESAWQIPYSNRVDSLTNFQYTRSDEDTLLVDDLVRDAKLMSVADVERIKTIALSDSRLVNLLVSPSGHVTGININILMPGKSLEEVPEVAVFSRKLADDFRKKYPHLDVYTTGGVMLDNAFAEAGLNDIQTLVPLMFVVLLILAGITLRAFSGTLAISIIIIFSTLTAMGLAGWFGITLTAASVGAPTLILTLAVADSVHILASMFQQMRMGKPKKEAIIESVRINFHPVFLTSITTAIGFLTMNFSDAPPFRDLGNIVAMGIVAAFIYSITLLPALMAVIPVWVKADKDSDNCNSCDRIADFVINKHGLVLWSSLLVIALLAAGNLRIELDDNFIEYFDETYDIRIASDFAIDNLRGFDIIEYSLPSGEISGINDPEYLKKVEAFTNWYRNQPNVTYVNTFTDTVKQLNKNIHADDPSYYRIPETRDLAAQSLLLYEMSLPLGQDLNNRINVDKSSTRVIVFFRDITSKGLREMDERARQWLRTNSPSIFTYGSGLSIIWAHISERNINSMLGASFGALVLISGILIIALRNIRLGILSLIPNLVPAIMGFGLWGFLNGRVGLGLSVVVAMALGIVVDDTVHFMSKYLRARKEYGVNQADAVRYTFNTVGTALWVTTVALTAGFLILSLSGYKMNADMGLMTGLIISLALVLDFLLLPVLLMKFDSEKSYV